MMMTLLTAYGIYYYYHHHHHCMTHSFRTESEAVEPVAGKNGCR